MTRIIVEIYGLELGTEGEIGRKTIINVFQIFISTQTGEKYFSTKFTKNLLDKTSIR